MSGDRGPSINKAQAVHCTEVQNLRDSHFEWLIYID